MPGTVPGSLRTQASSTASSAATQSAWSWKKKMRRRVSSTRRPQRSGSVACENRLRAVENCQRSVGGAKPSLNAATNAPAGAQPTRNQPSARTSRVLTSSAKAKQPAYRVPSFLVQAPRPAENPARSSSRGAFPRSAASNSSAAALARYTASGRSDSWCTAKTTKHGVVSSAIAPRSPHRAPRARASDRAGIATASAANVAANSAGTSRGSRPLSRKPWATSPGTSHG